METQDNGFLKEIDGVRKEKERLTAAKLFSDYLFTFLYLVGVLFFDKVVRECNDSEREKVGQVFCVFYLHSPVLLFFSAKLFSIFLFLGLLHLKVLEDRDRAER